MVIICPLTEGAADEWTVVKLAARPTVWVTGVEVDVAKLESPE
jgi:hypothetical protein